MVEPLNYGRIPRPPIWRNWFACIPLAPAGWQYLWLGVIGAIYFFHIGDRDPTPEQAMWLNLFTPMPTYLGLASTFISQFAWRPRHRNFLYVSWIGAAACVYWIFEIGPHAFDP